VRVLYISDFFLPDIGGVEVISGQLLSALKRKGHQFVVATSHQSSRLRDLSDYDGIEVHRFEFRRSLAGRDLKSIKEIVERLGALKRDFQPDLVHIAAGANAFFNERTRSIHPSRTLVTLHEMIGPAAARDGVLGRMFTSADWIVAVSGAVLSDLRSALPQTIDHSSLILNALEMPAMAPAPLVLDPPRLLCVGRLVREKGFDVAIKAMMPIVARFPAARMTIAGDGIARLELEELAQQLELADAIEFPGWVAPESIRTLINSSSIVVMPSRWQEPFGLVALEAAQMGRPIVATRQGGLPEIVIDGETGLLVNADDRDSLANAVMWLLERPEAARRMGAMACERAHERFSADDFANSYDALYRRLAGSEK
jgi:glycosyltransferase involved in cell wall biosynthesis